MGGGYSPRAARGQRSALRPGVWAIRFPEYRGPGVVEFVYIEFPYGRQPPRTAWNHLLHPLDFDLVLRAQLLLQTASSSCSRTTRSRAAVGERMPRAAAMRSVFLPLAYRGSAYVCSPSTLTDHGNPCPDGDPELACYVFARVAAGPASSSQPSPEMSAIKRKARQPHVQVLTAFFGDDPV